jgi:hypothetical protein
MLVLFGGSLIVLFALALLLCFSVPLRERNLHFIADSWNISLRSHNRKGLPDGLSGVIMEIADPDNPVAPRPTLECWTFRALGWSCDLQRQR